MLVVEFAGKIKVVPPPYIQADPTPFLQLTNIAPTGAAVDRGVIDLALDPQFATNRFYYIFYTAETPMRDRLSRFTANAALTGTIAGSEVILYQDTQDTTSASQSHHGGAIAFGGDGKIYFTTGDHFQGSPSQSLTSPRGKLHRINQDGTVPTDNPFYDGNGPNVDSIWASGLRNPYRMYYDAPTGRLYIGDVGGNDNSTSQEELDVAIRAANYGWPNVEGISSNPAYTNPIYSYPHNGRDASITGGFVYHGTQFPSSYQGSYFFADYTQNWIKRMTFDAAATSPVCSTSNRRMGPTTGRTATSCTSPRARTAPSTMSTSGTPMSEGPSGSASSAGSGSRAAIKLQSWSERRTPLLDRPRSPSTSRAPVRRIPKGNR